MCTYIYTDHAKLIQHRGRRNYSCASPDLKKYKNYKISYVFYTGSEMNNYASNIYLKNMQITIE